jgi:hypothetical protein
MKSVTLLHWAMHVVEYRRIAVAIKTAIKVGKCYINILFAVTLAAVGAIRSE